MQTRTKVESKVHRLTLIVWNTKASTKLWHSQLMRCPLRRKMSRKNNSRRRSFKHLKSKLIVSELLDSSRSSRRLIKTSWLSLLKNRRTSGFKILTSKWSTPRSNSTSIWRSMSIGLEPQVLGLWKGVRPRGATWKPRSWLLPKNGGFDYICLDFMERSKSIKKGEGMFSNYDKTKEKALSREFFRQEVVDLSRQLLGKVFVRQMADGVIRAVIVETEAYKAPLDKACHAYNSKIAIMKIRRLKGLSTFGLMGAPSTSTPFICRPISV